MMNWNKGEGGIKGDFQVFWLSTWVDSGTIY